MSSRIRNLILMGVFSALAYIVMFIVRIPVFGFLTYDPKDAIIGLAGFILGPLPAIAIILIVATLEMFTVSATGLIGFVMNAAASITFAGTAALIYSRKPSFKFAALGIAVGTVLMTVVMLALNFALTPLYMGVPRADVVALLAPVLLPFNLAKAAVNGLLILLLYRPVMKVLDAVGFREDDALESSTTEPN